jgi:hypothetical protein
VKTACSVRPANAQAKQEHVLEMRAGAEAATPPNCRGRSFPRAWSWRTGPALAAAAIMTIMTIDARRKVELLGSHLETRERPVAEGLARHDPVFEGEVK